MNPRPTSRTSRCGTAPGRRRPRQGDLDRMLLATYGGPFLFGKQRCMADAMYAPVVTRGSPTASSWTLASAAYCKRVMELPQMKNGWRPPGTSPTRSTSSTPTSSARTMASGFRGWGRPARRRRYGPPATRFPGTPCRRGRTGSGGSSAAGARMLVYLQALGLAHEVPSPEHDHDLKSARRQLFFAAFARPGARLPACMFARRGRGGEEITAKTHCVRGRRRTASWCDPGQYLTRRRR